MKLIPLTGPLFAGQEIAVRAVVYDPADGDPLVRFHTMFDWAHGQTSTGWSVRLPASEIIGQIDKPSPLAVGGRTNHGEILAIYGDYAWVLDNEWKYTTFMISQLKRAE